ncbi:NUDIX domain-containing protein [Candidatus Calescamantes bacterium]|nr:NUDIX domain-containing protein [Candidatus Calescamantes bacterium]
MRETRKKYFLLILLYPLIYSLLVFPHFSVSIKEATRRVKSDHFAYKDFLGAEKEVLDALSRGEFPLYIFGQIREMTYSSPTPGLGMVWMYEEDNKRIVRKLGGGVEYHLSYLNQTERPHDFPSFLGMVREYIKAFSGEEEKAKDRSFIFISDGGFKTRAGVLTLAYGYNGLVSLPEGKVFKDLQVPLGAAVLNLIGEGRQELIKDYLVWIASDNFLVPGDINWNGQKLSEMPLNDGTKVIISGAKVQLLDERVMDYIKEKLGENGGDWEALRQEIEKGSKFAEFRKIVEEHKIKELGVFTVKDGKLSGFGEKLKDLVDLVKLAYEKGGGAVYKNAFLVLLRKDVAKALYDELSSIKAFQSGFDTLDTIPVSFFQVVAQGSCETDEDWLRIGLKKFLDPKTPLFKGVLKQLSTYLNRKDIIRSFPSIKRPTEIDQQEWEKLLAFMIDWWNIRKAVLKVTGGQNNIYAIDLNAGSVKEANQQMGIWEDVGNLKKMYDLLSAIVEEKSSPARERVRAVLGIGEDESIRNSPSIEEGIRDGKVTLEDKDKVYIENVQVDFKGKGKLIIHEGVILKDVRLEVGDENVEIYPGTIIIESDLRGVKLTFNGKKSEYRKKGTVLSRVFSESVPDGELKIYPDEWLSTLKIKKDGKWCLTIARNIISIPYKAKIGSICKTKAEWEQLVQTHPDYLSQYNYDEVKDKSLFELNDENLLGYNFSTAQKNIDYRWQYLRAAGIRAMSIDEVVELLGRRLGGKLPTVVMDIDNTFVPKKLPDMKNPNNLSNWREEPYKELRLACLYQLLKRTKVVLISGNSRTVQTMRLIDPLKDYIKEKGLDMSVMKNLTVYFDGGALKITYFKNGNESLIIENPRYDSPGDIRFKRWASYNREGLILEKEQEEILGKLRELFNDGTIVRWLQEKAEAAGVSWEEVKEALKKWYDKEFNKRFGAKGYKGRINYNWLDGKGFNIDVLNSDFVELRPDQITLPRISFPWFEVRDGVQITIKLLPKSVKVGDKEVDIDIRGRIIQELSKVVGKEFQMRAGGFGSIDINKGRDKKVALEDYLRENPEVKVIYLGDEFTKPKGNDQPITEIQNQDLIAVISVGEVPYRDKMYDELIWVGGGPFATLKLFEAMGLVKFQRPSVGIRDIFVPELVEAVEEYTTKEGRLDLGALEERFGISQTDMRKIIRYLMRNGLIGKEYLDIWNISSQQGNFVNLGKESYVWTKDGIHQTDLPLWHACAHVLIVDEEGRILVPQRASTKSQFPNRYEILGGHLLIGETFEEGALREIKEELGINPEPEKLRLVDDRTFFKIGRPNVEDWGYKGNVFYYKANRSKEGKELPVYNYEVSKLFIYRVTEEEKEKIEKMLGSEVQAVEWLSIEELEDRLKKDTAHETFTDTPYQYFYDKDIWNKINRIIK